jgi:PAS domain S-box-containing protein
MMESSADDAARPATPRSGREAATGAAILIVEDNATTRRMMALALTREGYDVVEAGDGETAMRIVAERELAMVLMDCKLPDIDGFEVGRRLRVLVPSLPIVAITGWAQVDQARVLTAGFLEVLLKPVLPSRLVEVVDRYTRRSVPPPSFSGRLLILADDDAMQRKLGLIALTHAGFEVIVAEDGEEAMRLAAQRRPDVVVSDVLMPRMDGFGVCKAMRANPALSHVPIVLMSAHYLEAEDRKLAARFGANRYVSRTSGFGAVVVAVLEALDSPAVESVAPPTEDLHVNYVRRITHQLERQASLGAGLARQVSVQATALSVLDNLSQSLSQELDPESALSDTLAVCLDAAGLSVGAILLCDAKGDLRVKADLGAAAGIVWDAHAGVLRDAMLAGGLLIPAPGTAVAGRELLVALGVTSVLVVPIVARAEALGVLLLASSHTNLADAEGDTFVRAARTVSMQLGEALALSRMFAKLNASERRLRVLMEGAHDGIFVLDAAGRITDVNPATERFFGRVRTALLGAHVHEFVVPAERNRALEAFASLLPARRLLADAWSFARPDGSVVVGDLSVSVVETDGVAVAFGVLRDVTERVRTGEALRLSEARFTRLVESGIIGVGISDVLGTLFEANDTYLDMLGYSRAELEAGEVSWLSLAPPEWRSGDENAIAELAATGVARPWEKDLDRRDGTRVPVLVGVAMLDHPSCIVIVSDLSDRERAEKALRASEEQLRHAQKMEAVGRLAAGVAHDFNNLLSVIVMYAEMLVGSLKGGDPMREDVEEILKAGRRGTDVTRQLLMFSRQNVTQPRVLDLNEVVDGKDRMLLRIVGRDVTLVASKARALGRVRIDLSSIEQAIMNLVVNARDAMPAGGQLTLETANVTLDETYAYAHPGVTAGPHVMLAVTDTGTGMDAATQSRIFEPFFTTKPKDKGTGLGLSTVFGIVQQSGGSVWVYSELGKGTTFKVYLPRVDANVDRRPSQPAPATLRGTETVLLVEDDDPLRAAAMVVLRRHGYHVIAARHSGEALLMSEQYIGAIHLLMTDVVMPLLGGPDLARRLAKERPEMKVICMSGYTDDTIVSHGLLEAGMAYLQKPFTTEALARKTREVLDH